MGGVVMKCRSCQHRLQGKSLFSCLSLEQADQLDCHRIQRSYLPGQVLFLQNDPTHGVFCLQSGLVKLEANSSGGETSLLRLARPGEPLGYRACLTGTHQRYRATALTRVKVCSIPKENLSQVAATTPSFSLSLIQKLASDLEYAEERWLGLMQRNAEERVADILLEFQRVGEGWPNRKDMAKLVDLAPETFTRVLAAFEKRGWIHRTRKKLELLQPDELEKLAG